VTNKVADIEFTPVELDVLRMVVGNMSGREIAFALDVEPTVLEEISKGICSKLGESDRVAAAEAALRLGLIKLEL
jgi:DNA-binding NarL/FixJ family response regulator